MGLLGRKTRIGLLLLVSMAIGAGLTALLVNIFERKQEGKETFVRLAPVTEETVDAAEWGKNWPRQYDGYLRTSEATRTKYGGGVDPEGTIPEQKAKKDPWLARIFAGYLFAIDYRDRRGHAFMLHDQEVTKRNVPIEAKQSGNCLHCHASIMPLYRAKGAAVLPNGSEEEQIQKGLELVGQMGYWEAHKELGAISTVKGERGQPHPVSCVDCHDPKTMELRVTRPGFITGIQALAASAVPVPHLPSVERWRSGDRKNPYNPNTDGFRQEMRSFVCGQCHVEYFCGKGSTIFFPWEKGLAVEQIEAAYDARQQNGNTLQGLGPCGNRNGGA
jgi:nitrite reductase (cytochrome c-552)